MKEWIVGRNPVYEVIAAEKRQLFNLHIKEGANVKGRLGDIVQLCRTKDVAINWAPSQELDARFQNHQGVAIETSGFPYSNLDAILDLTSQRGEPAFILVLDTLQDPQNLASLLRTAEIVGVHGVLLPLRRTVTVTPAVVKASSGASEHLLITQTNLAKAIQALKEENIWFVGLEGSPEAQPPGEIDLGGPIGLVVGGEEGGMRSLVRSSCDFLMRLPMRGKIESLNAAVAGSVALYLAWDARGFQ